MMKAFSNKPAQIIYWPFACNLHPISLRTLVLTGLARTKPSTKTRQLDQTNLLEVLPSETATTQPVTCHPGIIEIHDVVSIVLINHMPKKIHQHVIFFNSVDFVNRTLLKVKDFLRFFCSGFNSRHTSSV